MTTPLLYNAVKVIFSAILIVVISEIAKRNTGIGAVLASIPLISLLAIVWLYVDTQDTQRIIAFSYDIFWLVLPSLLCFLALPYLLKKGIHFYIALSVAIIVTVMSYAAMLVFLRKLN